MIWISSIGNYSTHNDQVNAKKKPLLVLQMQFKQRLSGLLTSSKAS